jgi:hypothetical protein
VDSDLLNELFAPKTMGGEEEEDALITDISIMQNGLKNSKACLFWFVGHGICSNEPMLDRCEIPNQYWLSKFKAFATDGIQADAQLQGGEWCMQKFGVMGFDHMYKIWTNCHMNSNGETWLIYILDHCSSAQWIERMKYQQTKGINSRYKIVIQSACGVDENTFGNMFTPFLCTLQDRKLAKQLVENFQSLTKEEMESLILFSDFPHPQLFSNVLEIESNVTDLLIDTATIVSFPHVQTIHSNYIVLFNSKHANAYPFYIFCTLQNNLKLPSNNIKTLLEQLPRKLSHDQVQQLIGMKIQQNVFSIESKHIQCVELCQWYKDMPMAIFTAINPNDATKMISIHIHFAKNH